MNFWGHVALGAQACFQTPAAVSPANGSSEAEVSNLKIEELVIQNIFRLEISVCHALGVHVVKTI